METEKSIPDNVIHNNDDRPTTSLGLANVSMETEKTTPDNVIHNNAGSELHDQQGSGNEDLFDSSDIPDTQPQKPTTDDLISMEASLSQNDAPREVSDSASASNSERSLKLR